MAVNFAVRVKSRNFARKFSKRHMATGYKSRCKVAAVPTVINVYSAPENFSPSMPACIPTRNNARLSIEARPGVYFLLILSTNT